MSVNCTYCDGWLIGTRKHIGMCEECEEQVKKLDEKTVNWLVMVIDGRIRKELDDHTGRYAHESSHPGYY